MAKVRLIDMPCSIARSLDVVGEWWSLLVLRDVFAACAASRRSRRTSASRATSQRAAQPLRADGLLERHPYQERPLRYEYLLTDKVRDLYPVMIALIHLTCCAESTAKLVCTHCEGEITTRNAKYVARDDVRGTMAAAI